MASEWPAYSSKPMQLYLKIILEVIFPCILQTYITDRDTISSLSKRALDYNYKSGALMCLYKEVKCALNLNS